MVYRVLTTYPSKCNAKLAGEGKKNPFIINVTNPEWNDDGTLALNHVKTLCHCKLNPVTFILPEKVELFEIRNDDGLTTTGFVKE